MIASDEVEVETTQIFKQRKLELITVDGTVILFFLDVFESESPYVMIFIVQTAERQSIRMDVHKGDLARELRLWLEGKVIRDASLVVPKRVEGAMTQFIKYGKTPKQEDLIMWILSRTELIWGNDPCISFGGLDADIDQNSGHGSNQNQSNRAVEASSGGRSVRIDDGADLFSSSGFNDMSKSSHESLQPPAYTNYPSSTGTMLKLNMEDFTDNDLDNDLEFSEQTQKRLARSTAMSELMSSKVKGRTGAKNTYSTYAMGSERIALVSDIQQARKKIEAAMEEKRRCLEIARVRRDQAASRHLKIRAEVTAKQQQGGWVSKAQQELQNLHKIHEVIQEDIKRQKNKVIRDRIKEGWTAAPNGNVNRMGRSIPGPILGPGPLPPTATTSLVDPRLISTARHYYWDKCGRRHERPAEEGEGEGGSLVEQAMEVIRRAAANASAYKLDLKKVFVTFDTSGDGFLSCQEMADAFLSLGVQLDVDTMVAIFRQFDPNESGSVHYGEFVWAFFNRRAMVRQWKRSTKGFTPHQLRDKFHLFDVNGDGKLNYKEFQHLLLSFGIVLSESELDTLVARFDDDGDGCIDMHEFFAFIEGEKDSLQLDPQHESEHLQRSIRGTQHAGEHTRSYSPHRTRQDRPPSPSPSRGSRSRSASDWSKFDAPPALQRNWDHSPAKRRPPTSTSTYEGGPSPVERGLNPAHSSSIRFTDDRSRSATRSRGGSGYGESSRRSDSRGEGKESSGRLQRGTSRDDYDRTQEGRMKGDADRGRREGDLKSEYDDQPSGKIYTVIGENDGAQSYRTYVQSKSDHDIQFQFEGEDAVSGAEALWAAKMLQAQAHVETKLGRGYY